MVHISLLYIFTFFVFISARLISLFVLVLFDFGNVVFEYFAHLSSGIYHSCYPTPWDSFLFCLELLMMRTAVRGARGSHSPWVFIFLTYSLGDCWYGCERIFSELFSLITTSSLRENFALLDRSVLCVFTVVGRYCLRLTCVFVSFHFIFIVSAHLYI